MQRLTYINLLGERAEFGRGAPYLLRSVRGVGACDNALTLTEDGARDGGRLLSLRREAREITAVIQILGATRQGLYESREALCRVLSPDLAADGESRARLVYENDHGAWWTWVVPLGGLSPADARAMYLAIAGESGEVASTDGLDAWPDPDAVFIGGSGGELAALIRLALARLRPGGRLVMNFVTLENLATATATLAEAGAAWDVVQLQASRSQPILDMHRLAAHNPVWVVSADKETP